ncbi:PIN domain-containing protein [Microbacterium horticulturae]|uniref:PIN domain-containing protein n=1 Tax=Microbacterium horticulturae TaxID=3028316 RepID=A0ABY8C624_9MICO|nr:PIN domain-containing protein [Microbacterium sp. KACC 23027]WEG10273.1 PIN domain-containing protein [Microbacterium sp. KACC 23027]
MLGAADADLRARRLDTLHQLHGSVILPVDSRAAAHWARLRAHLLQERRRMGVNDLWIAAIAAANELPVVTQDADFDALEGAPGVTVIRV